MEQTSAVELLCGLIAMGDRESRGGKWRVSLDYDNVHDGARVLDGDEEVLGFCYDSPPVESGIPMDDERRCVEWQFCEAIRVAMKNWSKKIDASRESVTILPGGVVGAGTAAEVEVESASVGPDVVLPPDLPGYSWSQIPGGEKLGEGRVEFPTGPFTVSPGVCVSDVELLPGVPVPPASAEQFQKSFALHLQELAEADKEWAKEYEAWKIERHAAVYLDLFCQHYTEEQRRDFIQRVVSKCLENSPVAPPERPTTSGYATPVVPVPGLIGPATIDVKIPDVEPSPTGIEIGYDMSIHSNPDARAWARFFMETVEKIPFTAPTGTPDWRWKTPAWLDQNLMHGWFASAMCAMHDHDARQAAAERGRLMALIESWRTDQPVGAMGELSNLLPDLWELRQEYASQLATALQLDEASRQFPKRPAQVPMSPGRRDALGRLVRAVWQKWALLQPEPKASWLLPWEELAEPDREVDRQIGELLYAVGYTDMAFDTAPVSDLPAVKFYELRGSFPIESASGPFVDATDYFRLQARYKAQLSEIASHKRGILAAMERDENRLEKISKFRQIAWLIGSIYFYGNFKAETHNERMLEARLRELGYFFTTEEQLLGVRPADLPL